MVKPVHETKIGGLAGQHLPDDEELGQAAAEEASAIIRRAVEQQGVPYLVARVTRNCVSCRGCGQTGVVSWPQGNIFQWTSTLELIPQHPASFPHPAPPSASTIFAPRRSISTGQAKTSSKRAVTMRHCCGRIRRSVRARIGENGHIAFNDPPYADFHDPFGPKSSSWPRLRAGSRWRGPLCQPRRVSRARHHLDGSGPGLRPGEFWQLCRSGKAEAVHAALSGPITPDCPASILRRNATRAPVPGCQLCQRWFLLTGGETHEDHSTMPAMSLCHPAGRRAASRAELRRPI